jgi:hypothetical protein
MNNGNSFAIAFQVRSSGKILFSPQGVVVQEINGLEGFYIKYLCNPK